MLKVEPQSVHIIIVLVLGAYADSVDVVVGDIAHLQARQRAYAAAGGRGCSCGLKPAMATVQVWQERYFQDAHRRRLAGLGAE